MGEHLLCKQGVVGSNPISSTSAELPTQIRAERTKIANRFRHASARHARRCPRMTQDAKAFCFCSFPL